MSDENHGSAPGAIGAPLGRVPFLDGIRGVAILLVLAQHSPLNRVAPFGWAGVDLFFVLSGFLITRILLETKGSPRYFLNFYARRALRIWPLYYAMVAIGFGVVSYVSPALGPTRDGWLPLFLLYVQNFSMALGAVGFPTMLGVTWSLAIEEQYYMAWPLVVRFTSARSLGAILAAVLVASPLLRFVLLRDGYSSLFVNFATFTRLDAIAAGAAVALGLQALRAHARVAARIAGGVALAAIVAAFTWILLLYYQRMAPSLAVEAILYSILAVGFASFMVTALLSARVARPFNAGWLRYVGRVSYGLYVYHIPVIFLAGLAEPWIARRTGLPMQYAKALKWMVAIPAYFLVAELSWRYLESPILGLKARFEPAARGGAPGRAGPDAGLASAGAAPGPRPPELPIR